MATRIFVVDAFADGPCTPPYDLGRSASGAVAGVWSACDAARRLPCLGNPAGVCLLDAPRPDAWMLSVAAEMRHSETAFLVREDATWRLRWMTPTVEVDLCGHGTLASAHVLRETGLARDGETIRFATKSGELRATPRADGIEIDLPVTPVEPCAASTELAAALGVVIVRYGEGDGRCVAELATAAEVRATKPDMRRLATIPPWGVCITARSDDPRFDFVSRFFAPGKGVDEDPVTGSAHCALVDWWGRALGKTEFTAYQASARGGVVRVRAVGGRALLTGGAVTVLRGELAI